jgi:hypothetical protein
VNSDVSKLSLQLNYTLGLLIQGAEVCDLTEGRHQLQDKRGISAAMQSVDGDVERLKRNILEVETLAERYRDAHIQVSTWSLVHQPNNALVRLCAHINAHPSVCAGRAFRSTA